MNSLHSLPQPEDEWTSRDSVSESELIAAAQRDPAAFGPLYRRHAPAIQRYLRRRLGDPHIVEDALAETFTSALLGIAKFEQRGVPLRAWLYRLATASAGRVLRRAALVAMESLEQEPACPAADGGAEDDAGGDADHARAALLRIAPRFQAVLSLHYLEGLAVEEISQVLRCRPGTVKSRLARGRDALREELQRIGWKA